MKNAQRGMVLIEALLASAVLGIGLLGATRLTMQAVNTAADTRLRTVARTLALEAIECLQARRSDCPISDQTTVQGKVFTRQTRLQARPGLALTDVEVRTQWSPLHRLPEGQTQAELILHTSVSQVPTWVGVSSP